MVNKYVEHSKVNKNDFWKRIHKRGAHVCVKKRTFGTERQAIQFAHNGSYNQEPYLCDHCCKYHLRTIRT